MTHVTGSIHAKCFKVDIVNGSEVMCAKSKGHKNPEHFDPSADVRWTKGDAPVDIPTIVRVIENGLGINKASMPEYDGFVVRKVLWDMTPVALVCWAYAGDNLRERRLTDEVRQIAELLKEKGYTLHSYDESRNDFCVVPESLKPLS